MTSAFLKLARLLLVLAPVAYAGDFKADIDSLKNHSLRNSREIKIENLKIQLTCGSVNLKEGRLYLTGYFNGWPTAAFFLGEGIFEYLPPDEVEQQQVKRFYRSDSINISFDEAYFAFPWKSKIFEKLLLEGQIKNPPYRIKTLFSRLRKIPDKRFKYNLPFHIYKASVENQADFLWIDFLKDNYQHTVYVYDPFFREQVSVYKYTSNFKRPQLVSSVTDLQSGTVRGYDTELELFRYDIGVDISTYSSSEIQCRMLMRVLSDSIKYAEFVVPPAYKIDSVWGDAGQFIKEKDRPGLMTELSRFFYSGDTIEVNVAYRTNLFRHYIKYGVIHENLIHWYPNRGRRQLSDYRVRYSIAKGYDFISVGNLVRDTTIHGKRVLDYESAKPIPYVSFNYGLFDTVIIRDTGTPVTLYYLSHLHDSPISGSAGVRKVADDIAGSFDFYTGNFAPYPFQQLNIMAMSVGFGQGSPGLIHLSEATFNRSRKGVDDKFRAHEVAHQWWGHLVNPAGYHDVWLSEGLAEYSAAMYIQLAKKDERTFRQILKDWKSRITRSGKLNGRKSVGYRAGPIILGYRLGSELSPGDYEAIVYYKAAYLLHMLRFELEQAGRKEDSFLKVLSAFAEDFSGKLAATDDFIDAVRGYLGERTDQFFAQWLYDWRIPKMKKKYSRNSDGSVDVSIRTARAGNGFETPYPIRYKLSDGSSETRIYYVSKGQNQFHFIPAGGLEVKSVDFNPDFDILEL